ncbi:MAG: DUF6599 family protein [Bryobacterales bacterium]|nr:DUF6599 family protein [Bryobacterales bacterium]
MALALLAGAHPPDCAFIPGSAQQGEARTFDTETLFEYMNGNSRGVLSLRLSERCKGITCAKGDLKLIFDVSSFVDFESAYGMFTGNADPRAPRSSISAPVRPVNPRKAVLIEGPLLCGDRR